MKTIVLDAGHGGYDYGAVNGSQYEKDDNLKMARLVAAELERQGERVVMTRDSDVFIPLLQRSIISNDHNADMFVSFHRNAFTNPEANGVENYIQINSPPSFAQNAQNVLDEIDKVGVLHNRGVKSNNFSVLRNTRAPAMLLELGFISNARDNAEFDKNANAYAVAIAKGIMRSLGETYNPNAGGGSGGGSGRRDTAREIQRGLNETYGAGLAVDGLYGPATRRALVRAFQTELNELYGAGLVADGVFGAKTKAAARTVRRGARNNLVYILQALLFFKDYDIAVDGIFGAATETAVKAFQTSRNLAADGLAGPNTFAALFN
ncbi:MAG: N-acetylmuramoyl-L-alanine amidase [Clostridiales bacterium]|jgi:N-acetylmuramoyl-L-alanine amidase|nr:N-acetylmuramoyl-L-alanine amidase [Clostridiales bacterium]